NIVSWLKRRKSFRRLRRREYLVRQSVLANASQRACHHHPVWRTDHQPTGDLHESCTALLLQLAPQLVSTLNQRHVERMLEVGLANYPAVAVRGAERVTGTKLLDPKGTDPIPRQMVEGRRAHGPESDHDRVVASLSSHLSLSCIGNWNSARVNS